MEQVRPVQRSNSNGTRFWKDRKASFCYVIFTSPSPCAERIKSLCPTSQPDKHDNHTMLEQSLPTKPADSALCKFRAELNMQHWVSIELRI